jgi:hypothetical protein
MSYNFEPIFQEQSWLIVQNAINQQVSMKLVAINGNAGVKSDREAERFRRTDIDLVKGHS